MKKNVLIWLIVLCGFSIPAVAQTKNPNHRWFEEARFGLFVHFGPYSVLCDGEWVMNNRPISLENYHKLQNIFDPRLFDAKKWVQTTKEAGMKYITFTSRHHDSFSNWDTKQSDWNIMNTPYGKDLVKQLADECHKEDIKLVLYYSLLDWFRDDYSFSTGRTGKKLPDNRSEQKEWSSYIHFMKAQLTELLTNYGEIAGIWFDGEWDQLPKGATDHSQSAVDWHFDEIYELIHRLQPNCMIANNHHLAALPGEDYQAFEKDLPGNNINGYSPNQSVSRQLPLETCETITSWSWGYHLADNSHKSEKDLIHLLVRAAGYGANLLLNVGPMPTGEFDATSVSRLQAMGQWLSTYGQTIYGTQGGFIQPQSWGAVTQKDNIHYIHLLNKESDQLTLRLPTKIRSVRWMNGNGKITWKQNKKTGDVMFDLSALPNDAIDSILEVQY